MTDEQKRLAGDVLDLLRDHMASEFRHVHERMDQQAITVSEMRAENKADHKELKEKFSALEAKVETAISGVAALKQRADIHDSHHGLNDSAIAARITGVDGRVVVLEGARHDGGVVASVWRAQWKVLSGGIVLGGIIVGALHVLGVF